ncbi:MAG: NAD(P)H-dependent oxidoreductase [Actinomycetaceae bacterium]|nr:NAD(P)H-dependent oxidoreductase [Actinomycetaceae bacterium]
MYRIAIVQAGLSNPSTTRLLAEEFATVLTEVFEKSGTAADLAIVDVRAVAGAVVDATLTSLRTPELEQALQTVEEADAVVAISPTFKGSYVGLFKAFFDIVDTEALRGTPMVLAGTGGSERHTLMLEHAMRPLFTFFGADPVPTAIFAATNDFGASAVALRPRLERAGRELLARLRASVPGSVATVGTAASSGGDAPVSSVKKPLAERGFGEDVVPFATLMANIGKAR